ncbi:MAG: zinc ribbon domain-containing protein [Thermoplasmata archaeon]
MVVCPSCGASNTPDMRFCGQCGKEIPEELRMRERLDRVREPQSLQYARYCAFCGAEMRPLADFCPSCGRKKVGATELFAPYSPSAAAYASDEVDEYVYRREPRGTLVLGGIMIIISGLVGLVGGILIAVLAGELRSYGFVGSGAFEACGILAAVASIVPLYGGFQAARGRSFGTSLAAGIIGIVVGVVVLGLLGLIPGLIGVILVALARDDFED